MSMALHRSVYFKPLDYLIGVPLQVVKGSIEIHAAPDSVMIVEDYQKSVLVEMTFTSRLFEGRFQPRSYKVLVPKASIACGDVILKRLDTNRIIDPHEVSDWSTGERLPIDDI